MRIALDARLVGLPGIGRLTEGLWRGLHDIDADVVGLWPAGLPRDWLSLHRFEPPGPHVTVKARPFLPVEQATIPSIVRRIGADVHHATHFNVPYLSRAPIVVTVHDLFPYLDRSNARSPIAGAYYRAVMPVAMRRARVIAAISNFTARQLRESLGLPEERIRVIEHGLDHDRWQPPEADRVQVVRERFRLPSQYLLYVGTAKRHKNLATLIAAHRRYHPPLVLAGPTEQELAPQLGGVGSDGTVRVLGRVPDDVLPALYAGAVALVLPSTYEAVGFTALEAMACGSPVVVSDGGGLPDTVGDAGLLVPARDVDAWAGALSRISEDTELHRQLAAAGRQRVATRSWRICAQQYLDLYTEVARA